MGLTAEQIAGLMAKKRTKGVYEEKLNELYSDSDEAGVDVAETWPLEFAGKSATTLYQGFSNAAKKLEIDDAVDIVNRDGHVFILVKTRVALVLADTTANGHSEDSNEVEADAAIAAELV
jgi:hypothetical protein